MELIFATCLKITKNTTRAELKNVGVRLYAFYAVKCPAMASNIALEEFCGWMAPVI